MKRRVAQGALMVVLIAGGAGAAALAVGGDSTEGQTYTYNVAFPGPFSCPCGLSGDFGDQSPTTDVSFPAGPYTFTAPHVYATAGVYTYTLAVDSCVQSIGCPTTKSGTLTVADAPITGTSQAITATAGTAFTGALGRITDSDPTPHPASYYSATVNWGDGTTSPGVITEGESAIGVGGTHTWASAGTFTVHTTVTDHATGVTPSSVVLTSTATVAAAPTPTTTPTTTATTPTGPPPGINPATAVHLAIQVPFQNRLLSAAPFGFTATATSDAGGPVTVQWDFGEGRVFHIADLTNPTASNPFVPDPQAVGLSVLHVFAPVFASSRIYDAPGAPAPLSGAIPGTDNDVVGTAAGVDGLVPSLPPKGQSEIRDTYLVRAKATDQYGDTAIVGVPVVIEPDQPPQVVADTPSLPLEYNGNSTFTSSSFDTDNQLTKTDPGGRDAIISNTWDFGSGEGPPITCNPASKIYFFGCRPGGGVTINLLTARLAGRPTLDQYNETQTGAAGAADLAARAATLAPGSAATADQRDVTLTVTDRSGRTRSATEYYPMRRWVPPNPIIVVAGAKDTPGGGQQVDTPITAGITNVTLDLSDSVADPHGKIAYHVLTIGPPAPRPCPVPQGNTKCKAGEAPGLEGTPQLTQIVRGNGTTTIVFPKASDTDKPLSILDTAYDQTGQVGSSRYDGFVVLGAGGKCVPVAGQPIGGLVFSGNCMNPEAEKNGSNVWWTTQPIDLNGLMLRPKKGQQIIVYDCGGQKQGIIATAATSGHAACASYAAGIAPKPSSPSDLDVLSGGDVVAEMTPAEQGRLFDGVGDPRPYDTPPGGTYKGLGLTTTTNVTLTPGGSGRSQLDFWVNMPAEFAAVPSSPTTAETVVPAQNVPKAVIITKFDGNGAVESRARARHVAHAAGDPGPTTVTLPAGASLGPISIPGAVVFTYDKPTDTFTGSASVEPLPGFPYGATIGIVLRHGRFVQASGSISAVIPVAAAINLTGIAFTITHLAKDLTLSGTVHFADTGGGALLDGSGTLTVDLGSSPSLSISGQATLVKLVKLNAGIGFSGSGVSFNAGIDENFGPASYSANVGGFFASDGFQVSGSGRECLFACLGMKAIVSERAVAACGSLDLWLTSIDVGLGYRFKSKSLSIFSGSCDLSSYGSASALGGSRTVNPKLNPVFAESDAYAIKSRPNEQAMSIVVAPRSLLVNLAGADPSPLPFGETPQVYITDLDGNEVARTSTVLGGLNGHGNEPRPSGLNACIKPSPQSGVDALASIESGNPNAGNPCNHVLVDQDAVAGVVRFIIPTPAYSKVKGQDSYEVHVLGAGAPIAPPVFAFTDPPVDKSIFTSISSGKAPDGDVTKVESGKIQVVGAPPGDPDAAKPLPAKAATASVHLTVEGTHGLTVLHPMPAKLVTPVIDASAPQYAEGSTVPPTYKLITAPKNPLIYAASYAPPDDLSTYDLTSLLRLSFTGKLPAGQSIAFAETGPDTIQPLATAVSDEDGNFGGSFDFHPSEFDDRFIGSSDVNTHCISAFVSNQDGIPRGSVTGLACFKFQPPPRIDPQSLTKVVVNAPKGTISLDPDELVEGGGAEMFAVVLTDGVQTRSFNVSANSILQLQAQSLAVNHGARAARVVRAKLARTPLRKRSYKFTIRGLPKGKHKIRITIYGIRARGDKRKVGKASIVLMPNQTRGTIHFKRKGGRRI